MSTGWAGSGTVELTADATQDIVDGVSDAVTALIASDDIASAADVEAVTTDVIAALDLSPDPLLRVSGSVTYAMTEAGVGYPGGMVRSLGTLGPGETQSWIVEPELGRVIRVYRLVLVQAAAGPVQLLQGDALDDGDSGPLDALLPLGAGAAYVERDRHPIWTTAINNGVILERANLTTTVGFSVDYTET